MELYLLIHLENEIQVGKLMQTYSHLLLSYLNTFQNGQNVAEALIFDLTVKMKVKKFHHLTDRL